MAKLINPDGCLIYAHIDGSIVSVLLAASVLTDVNHLVKNTVASVHPVKNFVMIQTYITSLIEFGSQKYGLRDSKHLLTDTRDYGRMTIGLVGQRDKNCDFYSMVAVVNMTRQSDMVTEPNKKYFSIQGGFLCPIKISPSNRDKFLFIREMGDKVVYINY